MCPPEQYREVNNKSGLSSDKDDRALDQKMTGKEQQLNNNQLSQPEGVIELLLSSDNDKTDQKKIG